MYPITTNKHINRSPEPAVAEHGSDAAADTEAEEDAPETHQREINGVPVEIVVGRGKKGRGAKKLLASVKIDLAQADPFAQLKRIWGVEMFNRMVIDDLLMPVFREVTKESIDEKTGMLDLEVYSDDIHKYGLSQLRGGDGKRELAKKKVDIYNEITPFLMAMSEGRLDKADEPRYKALLMDLQEVNFKLEKKSRQGKKQKAA